MRREPNNRNMVYGIDDANYSHKMQDSLIGIHYFKLELRGA